MSEYPTRVCGPCPHLASFERTQVPQNTSYLYENTTPKPDFVLKPTSGIPEQNKLGVVSTNLEPNLNAREAKTQEFKGGIPPCQEVQRPNEGCCHTSEDIEAQEQRLGSACGPQNVTFARCQPQLTVEEMHATAGRTDPSHSSSKPTDLRPVPQDEKHQPCYLPQPADEFPRKLEEVMDPIGPWATGRVDWGPLSGLTGTRPVVDKYSITRYGERDWRAHNKKVLDVCEADMHRANLVDWNGKQCLEQTQSDVDKNQEDNTKRLNQKQKETLRWKCELQRAIEAMSEEITLLEEQRHRLKKASAVLTLPESISGECLLLRSSRLDSELVRDEVEEELIKEVALCQEIRDLFSRTLSDIEKQLEENKMAKQRLEYDWSDKTTAYEIDGINIALNNQSTILMFKPGAVCFPDGQSTPEYWKHFTKQTVLEGEATRQRSVVLRGTLDAILSNAARDLRSQADRVELALAKRVACCQEVTNRMEIELKNVLRRLVDIENLIDQLKAAIHRMDVPMKKAQTRLDNRLQRPRVENCRDEPHYGLVEEVKSISESIAALKAQLNQAETSRNDLMKVRGQLEQDIMFKKKTLEVDDFRTKKIRSYYPSATALTGY